ncbi:3588_t:CDS:2, partial [Acaulospora colombiana]
MVFYIPVPPNLSTLRAVNEKSSHRVDPSNPYSHHFAKSARYLTSRVGAQTQPAPVSTQSPVLLLIQPLNQKGFRRSKSKLGLDSFQNGSKNDSEGGGGGNQNEGNSGGGDGD